MSLITIKTKLSPKTCFTYINIYWLTIHDKAKLLIYFFYFSYQKLNVFFVISTFKKERMIPYVYGVRITKSK